MGHAAPPTLPPPVIGDPTVPDVRGPGHPLDEWVDITPFGGPPMRVLGVDGREVAIAHARELYVHDRIDLAELERRVDEALGIHDSRITDR